MSYSLFEKTQITGLDLRNRVVMAPMTRGFSPGNIPNQKNIEYYARRAANGVGLIITEGTCINHKAADGYDNIPHFYGEKALAGWKKVVDAVHKEGGKIFPQLWHVGSVRRADAGIGPDPTVPGYGPSGLTAPGKQNCQVMSEDDIKDCIAAYAQAAADAQRLGFDGIELHGAHGYLIDQFFWQGTNVRDDRYGGDLMARCQFAVDVIKAVREAVGPNYPIMFRWSQWKLQDYSARLCNNVEELTEFLKCLVDAGVDIFHCSQRRFWQPEFEGSNLNLAGWVKKLTAKPCVTVGSVGLDGSFIEEGSEGFNESKPDGLEKLSERLANEEFELVAVGRALISNPDWITKVQQAPEQLKPFDKKHLTELI